MPSQPASGRATNWELPTANCLQVRAKSALTEERSLVPSLMAMLDHTLPSLRAKAVVALLLLCRLVTCPYVSYLTAWFTSRVSKSGW